MLKSGRLFYSLLLFLATVFYAYGAETKSLPITQEQIEKKGNVEADCSDNTCVFRTDDPKSGLYIIPLKGKLCDWSGWKYLEMDIENLAKSTQLRLNVQPISNKDGKRKYFTIGIALNPGEKRTLRLLLPHKYYLKSPSKVPGVRYIDTDNIEKIEFFLQWPFEQNSKDLIYCRISNIRLRGKAENDKSVTEANFFPFIDRYGQYIHKDWKEKIKNEKQLRANLAKEANDLAKNKPPVNWNKYGGWKDGPHLKATGNFRTEKYEGKWYLVDPEGCLFFSTGLDVLYPHTDATGTKGHEKWFNIKGELPSKLAFTDDNLKIKYGTDDYKEAFFITLTNRLKSWGFNSIGDWGNSDFIIRSEIPYTLQITDYMHNLPKIGKLKFNDVFDPRYISAMKTIIPDRAENSPTLLKSINDPMCIGYFIDNEIRFGNWSKDGTFALVGMVLKSPATQAAKKEFISDLKIKYLTIEKLNDAWNTLYKSWDDLLQSRNIPAQSKAFDKDATLFFRKTVEQYFRLCNQAIKSIAPHRLYLGCRFLSTEAIDPILSEMSKKYCDVMTVNIYSHTPANFPVKNFVDMPVLVGEFHFGVLDRGMFSPGLCLAGVTQEDRALAYTRYMQGALINPNIIGAHWFQFRDQPLTGRWDGEGYSIGFTDVADTPYYEMIKASRTVAKNMYEYRKNGKLVEFTK